MKFPLHLLKCKDGYGIMYANKCSLKERFGGCKKWQRKKMK